MAMAHRWRLGHTASDTVVKLDAGALSLVDGMHFLGTITDSTPGNGAISPLVEAMSTMRWMPCGKR